MKRFLPKALHFTAWAFLLLLLLYGSLMLTEERGLAGIGVWALCIAVGLGGFIGLKKLQEKCTQQASPPPEPASVPQPAEPTLIPPVSPSVESAPEPSIPRPEPPGISTFTAAGKPYVSTAQLTITEDEEGLARDRYGRPVLHIRERFPCFDSFDLLYEKRYFHWYLLCREGGWTLVKSQDERTDVEVQEDLSFEQAASLLISREKNIETLMKGMEKESENR